MGTEEDVAGRRVSALAVCSHMLGAEVESSAGGDAFERSAERTQVDALSGTRPARGSDG